MMAPAGVGDPGETAAEKNAPLRAEAGRGARFFCGLRDFSASRGVAGGTGSYWDTTLKPVGALSGTRGGAVATVSSSSHMV